MKILLYSGVAAAVVAIAVAAIISSQANSAENGIRVVFFPNISHAVPIVGLQNGEFSQELGDIPINTIIVDSGPQAVEALFANSADLAYMGPAPFINGYIKSGGAGLKILAGAAANGASLVIQKDSEISSIADLAGKKIAAPSLGNTQDVSLRYYLLQNNLKPAERGGSVVVYNIANSETYTLFAKGDIDAAWVPEPLATMLVENLGGKRLFSEEELWPAKEFPSVVLVGRTDFIQNHPDLVAKWLEAHKNTIQWINENPDETESVFIEFYKKHTGKTLPQNIVHGSFSNILITSDPNEEAIQIFAERAYELGYLGRNGYDISEIFYAESKAMGVIPWQN